MPAAADRVLSPWPAVISVAELLLLPQDVSAIIKVERMDGPKPHSM